MENLAKNIIVLIAIETQLSYLAKDVFGEKAGDNMKCSYCGREIDIPNEQFFSFGVANVCRACSVSDKCSGHEFAKRYWTAHDMAFRLIQEGKVSTNMIDLQTLRMRGSQARIAIIDKTLPNGMRIIDEDDLA